ncbi:RNA-directed DNA polymerase, eukaryota [Tanacetum coccineum]
MYTTHMNNQTTSLATMNTVHKIPLAVLRLILTFLVLHLNLTLSVLHLPSDILTYSSGADDANYIQRAMTDYQVKYSVLFTLLHCWEVLKECDKWNSGEVPRRWQLNSTTRDEKDKVEEVCRSRPIGRDQAKRKVKARSSSAGSTNVRNYVFLT